MSYKLQFQENYKIIEAIYSQETEYKTRLMALEKVINYINLKGNKYNLLIDVRNIENKLTTNQEYEFGIKLAASKELIGAQVAVLNKQQTDQNNFINTVAINRGYNLRAFTCYNEATKWLKKQL